jgi:TetR/AcrR family transcriptional regulator, transcriptional repressor for nem operon
MRKSRQETAETRQRIVEAASAEFRRNGINGTGLAELMAAAGMTHGGFYKHFESKEQVVVESLALALETLLDELSPIMKASAGSEGLNAAVTDYLSLQHLDDPSGGCPYVALGSEMARASVEVRDAATSAFVKLAERIADQLEDMPRAAAKKEALVILSTMVGAMTLARLVNEPDLSASILRQARKHLAR